MKQIIALLIFVLTHGIGLNAQDNKAIVISAGKLKNIQIGNDLEVVLIHSSNLDNEIRIDPDLFKLLSIRIDEGTLEIRPKFTRLQKEKIFVLVESIENLTVGNNSRVITHGTIDTGLLNVFASSGSHSMISTTGRVKAYPVDDSEVRMDKITGRNKDKNKVQFEL